MTTRGTDWESKFVAEKRKLGASWQAVARMLGRSVEDVRRDYDRASPVPLPAQPAPSPASGRHPSCRPLGEGVMAILYKSRDPVSPESLGGKIGQNIVSQLRKRHGPSIIITIPGGYRLTAAGRSIYEAHYQATPNRTGSFGFGAGA